MRTASILVLSLLVAAPVIAGKKADPAPTPAPAKAKFEMPPDMESHTLVLLVRGDKAAQFSDAELEKLQKEHLAHLDKLANDGKIVLVGPFLDSSDETIRGGCIYSVPVDEARKLAEEDPMVKAGRLKVTAMSWWVGKGWVAFPKAKAAKTP